jgi:membrane protein implicated in regulation of membrane protease activity
MKVYITPTFIIIFFIGFATFIVGLFIEGCYEWECGCWSYSAISSLLIIIFSYLFLKYEKEEDILDHGI